MKHIVSLILIITLAFVAYIFTGESAAEVVTGAAAGWIAVLTAWLGLDIAKMHDRTVALPKGTFSKMKWTRYLFSVVSLVGLYVLTRKIDTGDGAKAILVTGIFGMVATFVAAYGVNKVATEKGGFIPPASTGPKG